MPAPVLLFWWSQNATDTSAMFLKRILYYLNPVTLFGKGDGNSSLRFMHGINRISIFLFLFCVVVMVIRAMNR